MGLVYGQNSQITKFYDINYAIIQNLASSNQEKQYSKAIDKTK